MLIYIFLDIIWQYCFTMLKWLQMREGCLDKSLEYCSLDMQLELIIVWELRSSSQCLLFGKFVLNIFLLLYVRIRFFKEKVKDILSVNFLVLECLMCDVMTLVMLHMFRALITLAFNCISSVWSLVSFSIIEFTQLLSNIWIVNLDMILFSLQITEGVGTLPCK